MKVNWKELLRKAIIILIGAAGIAIAILGVVDCVRSINKLATAGVELRAIMHVVGSTACVTLYLVSCMWVYATMLDEARRRRRRLLDTLSRDDLVNFHNTYDKCKSTYSGEESRKYHMLTEKELRDLYVSRSKFMWR